MPSRRWPQRPVGCWYVLIHRLNCSTRHGPLSLTAKPQTRGSQQGHGSGEDMTQIVARRFKSHVEGIRRQELEAEIVRLRDHLVEADQRAVHFHLLLTR